jgi:hypothetical protein
MPTYYLLDGVVCGERPRYSREEAPTGAEVYTSQRRLAHGQRVTRRRAGAWAEGWTSRGGYTITTEQYATLRRRAAAAGRGVDAYCAAILDAAAAEDRDVVPVPPPMGTTKKYRVVCGPSTAAWLRARADLLGCTLASLVRGLLAGELL